MTYPTMRLVENPNPEAEFYELWLVLELGNGLEVKTLLTQQMIDEISMKGGGYFISMQADGTALICCEDGDVPEMQVNGKVEHDTFRDIVEGYLDSASFADNLYKTRNHVRRLRDSLAFYLEQADKALDEPWPDDYLEEWKKNDDREYRIPDPREGQGGFE